MGVGEALAGAVGLDADRDRVGDADRIGDLHERLVGEPGRDQVLGHVARGVGRRAVHLGGVLAREGATAMGALPAVRVDDDLAAREPRVAVRPADHERARRVDVQDEAVVHHAFGEDGREDVLADVGLDLGERRVVVLRVDLVVLGRDHDRVDALGRPAVGFVLDRDLALGVRPEVGHHLARLADLREALHEAVREHQRERHQRLLVLAGGVAEHHALVPGALLDVEALVVVDALRDVGRLLVDRDQHAAGTGVELEHRVGVADLLDGRADDLLHVDVGVTRDLARDHDEARRAERLDGAAAGRVAREEGVEEGVGDLVRDFVRVAFGDGLGGEEDRHGKPRIGGCRGPRR